MRRSSRESKSGPSAFSQLAENLSGAAAGGTSTGGPSSAGNGLRGPGGGGGGGQTTKRVGNLVTCRG